MTPREILIGAKARVSRPSMWTNVCAAIHTNGYECHPRNPQAAEISAEGAMLAVTAPHGGTALRLAFESFEKVNCDGKSMTDWERATERTHGDVMAAFDRAIEYWAGFTAAKGEQ